MKIENPITYSLRDHSINSEHYYQRIAEFTDLFLRRAEESVFPIVDNFRSYIVQNNLEDPRSREEYCYELLAFSILWKTYGTTANDIRWAPYALLTQMADWRKRHHRLKPAIDRLRGIAFTLFLSSHSKKEPFSIPSLSEAERLLHWLDATGEFREDAIRFIFWWAWWNTLSPRKVESIFSTIIEFGMWFESESLWQLGEFTFNVDVFLSNNQAQYRWREDQMSCLRTRVEYHLNMVGAEIMNRAYRNDFAATHLRVVLVPGCMRKRSDTRCKAQREIKGLRCTGCEDLCNVNRIRAMGLKDRFETYVIPHASDLSLWSAKPGDPHRGVVGIACLTTLVEGGWELRRHNIPAQCVLLDYCGCQKHWHETGIPTELNIAELKRKVRV